MRISELRNRLAAYLPDPDTYARDTIHSELGGISVNDAIAIGMEPDEIWRAVIRHNPSMPEKYK
ncbi:DUF3046 domain-containing protein [Candidatus Nanopelagicus hibericus]|jgi:hypothetical protein|uniref:DUF3046 domain-containing protein n=1 Tax=Candidatus Nanopelagicus hibericus TaxID=1884915 RepID=A0A249K9P0_9ACTN|nr:DUF3046 domain-containing protein [Candidatus Nanopelagicus hibericus]ASY13513.1 DUF3046 domain-containing protein [Candidatus Nanopelagicus hibericus]